MLCLDYTTQLIPSALGKERMMMIHKNLILKVMS